MRIGVAGVGPTGGAIAAHLLPDLAGAIVFLASDVSALMTATPLVVDGGWAAE